MRVGAFAPEAAFLPALAGLWLNEAAAAGRSAAEGLIILPSKRAAQALGAAFLEARGGEALLLPRIIALGNVDEAGVSLHAGLTLAPAMKAPVRQAALARLVLAMNGAGGAPRTLAGAWALAAELAALLDEADHAEIDLAAALPGVVSGELARHWQDTLRFLEILTQAWPAHLAERGLMNPAARLARLISAQAELWGAAPPRQPVWLVAAEGTPAIGRLARAVARAPKGRLVLPGFDFCLPAEAWAHVADSHPQAGIAGLLGAIGARPAEVERLPAPPGAVPAGRALLVSAALWPARHLAAWREVERLSPAGLARLEAGDEAQDALAIAMILRDVLEVPGRSAALVTPDRDLAARVAAALRRFGITADDSAGEPLAETPPAMFLRLLARAGASAYAPLPLLSLLKHPLAAAGWVPGTFRDFARRLERHALRGPRPPEGLEGLRFRLADERQEERDFLTHLEMTLRPLALGARVNPAQALRALIEAGEALAATHEQPGAAVLWAGEAGGALSALLGELLAALEGLPDIEPGHLPELLDELLKGAVVRRPRAKDGHPRIAIWGIQEAALQTVDVAVLGGLVEGVWPGATDPGPWLSRPMRKAVGLASPELKVGQAAHGFFGLMTGCPALVLSAPRRRERAPAVPARWLTRLDALLAGQKLALPAHEAGAWATQLDLPPAPAPRAAPAPRPPAAARPRQLSVSDIATLICDPYAVYARKILGLAPLDALDEESDASQFGEIVHAGLKAFFDEGPEVFDGRAVDRLAVLLEAKLRELRPRAALQAWWRARLARIAGWVVAEEAGRRAALGTPAVLAHEVKGKLPVAGGFELVGRADRLERGADGLVRVLDYKTGTVPPQKAVADGSAPQLPLEAVMAEAGAFGEGFGAEVGEICYVRLSGRAAPGEARELMKKDGELRAVIDAAAQSLPALFAKYGEEATPYLAAPHPARANPYDVYGGVSRRGEWEGEG
ncbi:double-strand break repair protein AddB [Acidocella sp.]|uniref:double-strand break repair protein AddB n=1 Tax=Acidocella sp. TaxID=50710 RepID=UPI00260669BE|nr:double-strand break repair protein AddB [Acidocella sp.]